MQACQREVQTEASMLTRYKADSDTTRSFLDKIRQETVQDIFEMRSELTDYKSEKKSAQLAEMSMQKSHATAQACMNVELERLRQ